MRKPIAIACSDIHLSESPPVARAGEKDWLQTQKKALMVPIKASIRRKVPLIVAGDLFHRPKATPATEMLAMSLLPKTELIMIPGQHDLINHSIDNISRGSYGVVEAHYDALKKAKGGEADWGFNCDLFPFGSELTPCPKRSGINIAVIHTMVWEKDEPYPGAPISGNAKNIAKKLAGYDFIVAGDNHGGFSSTIRGSTVVNCGSLLRRSADQYNYKPRCYVLYDDLTVEEMLIPTREDAFSREHRDIARNKDTRIEAFVDSISDIQVDLSFETNMERFCEAHKTKGAVRELIAEAMTE